MLVSVQSLAVVCLAECGFNKLSIEQVTEKKAEHQGCHQSKTDKEDSSDKEDCASKVCQLEDIAKLEAVDFQGIQTVQLLSFHLDYFLIISANPSFEVLIDKSPPGFLPFHGVALYIQKSSYLI